MTFSPTPVIILTVAISSGTFFFSIRYLCYLHSSSIASMSLNEIMFLSRLISLMSRHFFKLFRNKFADSSVRWLSDKSMDLITLWNYMKSPNLVPLMSVNLLWLKFMEWILLLFARIIIARWFKVLSPNMLCEKSKDLSYLFVLIYSANGYPKVSVSLQCRQESDCR